MSAANILRGNDDDRDRFVMMWDDDGFESMDVGWVGIKQRCVDDDNAHIPCH